MSSIFNFNIIASEGKARTGKFSTPHGDIFTPVFAPVGTQATVKTLTNQNLYDLDASLILSNTYHLYLRPGDEIIRGFGGLHEFMNWRGPILTDSGGFQVFSLAKLREIDQDGVSFRSHIDGSLHRFTPEKAIEIQENLGADIIMAFDECADPYDYEYNRLAVERTHRWAERCLEAKTRNDQALFGIVQGGIHPDLRLHSAHTITSLDFDGIAIGGLSVGETKDEMYATLDTLNPHLPMNKPRYLMGVGTPEDIFHGIARGIDIFDCVLPTRLARHKSAFTLRGGRLNLSNREHANSTSPIDAECECYTCRNHSRGYLRHLIAARESLSGTLLSIHNLHVLIHLTKIIQQKIIDGTFEKFMSEFLNNLEGDK